VSLPLYLITTSLPTTRALQVFSVALSGPLLGVQYPGYVWLSLLPIVGGCAMSAMKEVCVQVVSTQRVPLQLLHSQPMFS
jgi:hypothetical protein